MLNVNNFETVKANVIRQGMNFEDFDICYECQYCKNCIP